MVSAAYEHHASRRRFGTCNEDIEVIGIPELPAGAIGVFWEDCPALHMIVPFHPMDVDVARWFARVFADVIANVDSAVSGFR